VNDEDKVSLKEYFERILNERDKALDAALVSINERLKLLNELRGGVATKEQLIALEKVLSELKDRFNQTEGKSAGLDKGWVLLIGFVALVGGIIAIVSKL